LTAIGFSLLLASVGVRSVAAQAILDGKATGTVMSDDGAPLPGATVEISGPALLGGSRTTTTSERGTYVFLNLPIGTYSITASRDAFKSMMQENVVVSAASVVTVDFTLPVGAVEEFVTVSAQAPIVDTKTSTMDAKIDRDLMDKIPTSRDAFYDLSLMTAGMAPGSGAPTQSTEFQSPTAYSSATNENVFLINGVDATSPRAGSFGSLVNVNYDIVEEVRVVALGSRAEYGSFSGAAMDVVTKSGGNDFSGSMAFYSKLGSVANNQPGAGEDLGRDFLFIGENAQLAGEVSQDWEASGTLGGPVVKDRAWFFGAFDYLRGASIRPRWPLESESWGRYVDAKLSTAPLQNHQAWVAYHFENNDANGGSWGTQPGWDTTMTYGTQTVNNTLSAQWQWLSGPKTTVSAKWLGFWTDDKPYIPADAPDNPGYINWWKWTDAYGSYGINGAFPYVEGYQSSRNTIQGDLSHYAEDFLGEHDLKFGVQYTKGRSNSQGGYFQNYVNFLYPYRWTQNVNYLQSWYGDTGLLFYNQKDTINPSLTVRTGDSFGMFFDDQWTPNRRLTVNFGLRFDHMTSKYGAGKVYEFPGSPDAINDPPPVLRDRASTDNIFDFTTLAPRIGLTYQLTDDGKTVARASYGRYYQPLNAETLRRFGPDMPLVSRQYQLYEVGPWERVDTNGDGFIDSIETREAARLVHGLTPLSEQEQTIDYSWTLNVQDGLKNQHTDQVTFSVEREIAPNLSVSGTYIYKHSADLFTNIPINRQTGQQWEYERIPFQTSEGQNLSLYSVVHQDYDSNGVIDGADVAFVEDNNTYSVQNLPAFDGTVPTRDFHGLQAVVRKRLDRWQALASILYSSSSGFSRRSFRQDFNVELPMFYDDTWMGNLNYAVNNLEGPLPYTPTWETKISASYSIPGIEVDLGGRLRAMTGRPVWRLDNYPQHTQFGDPPGGIIIPGGLPQVVSVDVNEPDNLPNLTLFDIHAAKIIRLNERQSVHVVLDGFNLFNTNVATDMGVVGEGYGNITNIPQGRRFRFGLRFEF
jgi:hypothetical protein